MIVDIRPAALRWVAALEKTVDVTIRPWLMLGVRLTLAQAFLLLQLRMAMGQGALAVRADAGMLPTLIREIGASGPGTAIGFLCPVLLLAGLCTRPAALAMLVAMLMLPLPDVSASVSACWAMLLCWIAVTGPGPLSFDRLLGGGLAESAVPGAARVAATYAILSRWGGRTFLLLLRLWLAAGLIASPIARVLGQSVPDWLPGMPGMAPQLSMPATMAAALLIGGLGTRPLALVLLLLVPVGTDTLTLADQRLYWLLLLAILLVQDAGTLSLDTLLSRLARGRAPPSLAGLPQVVIVGAGFGGIAAAQKLRGAPCRVTLLDRHNYHLFQPLLYQVATAGLSPADIATPIRGMFRDQRNLRALLGEVTGVDVAGKAVLLGASRMPYDTLILATGARHSYFGHEEWTRDAPGLKGIEDAIAIRRRLLNAFEQAEETDDEAARRAWLTFVVVGAGPTGVELAGAIAELSRGGFAGEFRSIDPASARVVLVQAGPRVLPAFAPSLSTNARAELERLGVEISLDSKVDAIDAGGVTVGDTHIEARTVLWAAGVMASPAAAWLGAAADRSGRIAVAPDLSVPGGAEVFAIGDTVVCKAWAGQEVPGLGPAAKQEGAYVARVLRRRLAGRPPPPPFRYRHMGSLATIGRQAAVVEFGPVRLHGALAWWLWGGAHIAFLVGGRNRVSVLVEWLWAYLTFRRSTRLITGDP